MLVDCRPRCRSSIGPVSDEMSVALSLECRPRCRLSIGPVLAETSVECRPSCRSSVGRDVGQVSAELWAEMSVEYRPRSRSSVAEISAEISVEVRPRYRSSFGRDVGRVSTRSRDQEHHYHFIQYHYLQQSYPSEYKSRHTHSIHFHFDRRHGRLFLWRRCNTPYPFSTPCGLFQTIFRFSALLIPPLSFTGLYLSSERGRQIPTIQRSAGKTGVNSLQFFVDKCVYISVSARYFI